MTFFNNVGFLKYLGKIVRKLTNTFFGNFVQNH